MPDAEPADTLAYAETTLQNLRRAAPSSWTTDEAAGTSDLMLDGKPVIRYMFAFDDSTKESALETYKVYHHVFGS